MVFDARTSSRSPRTPTLAVVLAALPFLGACANASEDDFRAEMADVRAGDAALADRVSGLEARMDAAAADLEALEDDLDMEVERLEASLRVHTPVHFAFDSHRIEAGPGQEGRENRRGVVIDHAGSDAEMVAGRAG